MSKLEDVPACDYFLSGKGVPAQGTRVRVANATVGGRLLVVDEQGAGIGFLPARFDPLLGCLSHGIEYRGRVSASALRPVPIVKVELSSLSRPPPPGGGDEPADGP
ncbi:MAG: hypothetical protein AB1578_10155 [Thermodesulfobacteriota bacterium]